MIKSLFICLFAGVLTVQAATLTAAQRAQIWTEVWSDVDYHFAGFERLPAVQWQDSLQPVMTRLLAIPSDVDFWREIRAVVNSLNDGQTTVMIPSDLPREYDTIPMRMMIADGKILVRRLTFAPSLAQSGIKIGDELVAINGTPALEVLRNECYPHVAGSTSAGRMAQAAYRILTGKADSDAKLSMKRPDGKSYDVTIKRVSNDGGNYYSALTEPSGIQNEIINKDILYYRIDSFYQWDIKNDIFGMLSQNPKVKDLILDLRWNHTGPVPKDLISRFAYFPLPMNGYKECSWKSDMTKGRPDSLRFVRDWRTVDPELVQPADSVFRGRVVVLVSPETSGPAELFLEPLIFAGRVTLIGDTTAGAGGTAAAIVLPAGGQLWVTTRQPVWEKGYGVGKGFVPDVRVIPTAAGLAAGKDDVRDAAVDYLKKGKK